MTNNNFGNVSNSALSFGDGSTNTVNNTYNQESTDLTNVLLKQLNLSDIETEKKEELKELIESAHEESIAENPKRTRLKSFLDSSNNLIDTVTKSPSLITAYEKWAQFIQNPPTF